MKQGTHEIGGAGEARAGRRLLTVVLAALVVLTGLSPAGGTRTASAQEAPGTGTPGAPEALEDGTARDGTFDYGVHINPYEIQGGEEGIRAVLDRADAAGVNSLKLGADWPTIQPTPGEFNVGPIDTTVRLAQERGMRVSLTLNATPDWVHPDLAQTVADPAERRFYPPVRNATELDRFRQFAGALAQRYGDGVARYEIWNEPNVSSLFFKPYTRATSPAPYAQLLKAGYEGVKGAAPNATVDAGNIAGIDTEWLQAFYDAARLLPGAAENRFFFDELDAHPYSFGDSPYDPRETGGGPLNPGVIGLPELKAVMDRNGDAGKNIFAGEVGYQTQAGTFFPPVTDETRALYLKQTYASARELPYVSGVGWYAFNFVDRSSQTGEATTGGTEGWAILGPNLEPTRSYQALAEVTGARASVKTYPQRPVGDVVTGPYEIRPVYEGGAAPSDVTRYELYVDGALAQSSAGAPFVFDPSGVADGQHTFILAAYTSSGSVYSAQPLVLTVRNTGQPTELAPASQPGTQPAPGTPPADGTDPNAEKPCPTAEPGTEDLAPAGVRVESLAIGDGTVEPGAPVKASATISAEKAGDTCKLVVAVRPKGSDEVLDFPAHEDARLGPEARTFSSERTFEKPGTYQAVVAYFAAGSWHTAGEPKEFSVTEAEAPAPDPAPAPAPAPAPNAKPTVSGLKPANGSSTRDRTPTVAAIVRDAETNLSKANVRLYVDGKRVTGFAYDARTDRLRYTAPKLRVGTHKVKVVASDAARSTATKQSAFTVR